MRSQDQATEVAGTQIDYMCVSIPDTMVVRSAFWVSGAATLDVALAAVFHDPRLLNPPPPSPRQAW